ncbi:hypothetical protein [Williamwhitmania taraxaci]|nr:hypothetical protein [Williamwhitmania taraxaci]
MNSELVPSVILLFERWPENGLFYFCQKSYWEQIAARFFSKNSCWVDFLSPGFHLNSCNIKSSLQYFTKITSMITPLGCDIFSPENFDQSTALLFRVNTNQQLLPRDLFARETVTHPPPLWFIQKNSMDELQQCY